MRAATPGLSGTDERHLGLILVERDPRTTMSSMFFVSSFTMVPGLSFKLDRTSNTTPNFLAIPPDRLCMTLAPRLASSSISHRNFRQLAGRGHQARSAVYTPSTIRVNLAQIRLEGGRQGNGRQIRTAPAKAW